MALTSREKNYMPKGECRAIIMGHSFYSARPGGEGETGSHSGTHSVGAVPFWPEARPAPRAQSVRPVPPGRWSRTQKHRAGGLGQASSPDRGTARSAAAGGSEVPAEVQEKMMARIYRSGSHAKGLDRRTRRREQQRRRGLPKAEALTERDMPRLLANAERQMRLNRERLG
jgi:hypothetical protein